jgi:serine/threonine-protein kinase SRPK3
MFDDNICLVFDLMIGSLYDMIKKGGVSSILDNTNFKSGFSLDFVIKTTKQILESLSDLHAKHIIHGDVKPENILLHGKTKIHEDIIAKLGPKTNIKKISECVKEINRTLIKSHDYTSDSESESEETTDSDESERSGMSVIPEKILISDSDKDSDETYDSDEDKETLNNIVEGIQKKKKCHAQFEIDRTYIDNPSVKLSDLGSCVDLISDKKPIGLQTKYYKSPELILGLPYDESCDIWALGCTIYELLTGTILFDPDDYETDKKRCMLHQIYAKIGKVPDDLIAKSPLKQIFFSSDTDDSTILRAAIYTDEFDLNNTWIDLLENISGETAKKFLVVDLILEMLTIDPSKRISADNSLKHPLFKLYA